MGREINNAWLVQERDPDGEWLTTLWIPMAKVTHSHGNELMEVNQWCVGEARAALQVHKNMKATPKKEHRYIADHHHAAPPPNEKIMYVSVTYGTWQ